MNKTSQHIQNRQVDTNLHTVWIDEVNDIATFPIWSLTGQLIGYQHYRARLPKTQKNNPKFGKYYTYLTKRNSADERKSNSVVGVWGLESWKASNTLFVTEGIFDAATLTNKGVSAIAALSNDPSSSFMSWLRIVMAMRPVVAVCDPGKAGRKLAKCGHRFVVVNVGNDLDLNDAAPEYVDNLIKEYSK